MMKGIAYFAPYRMDRRGMERRVDPKPVRVLMRIETRMSKKSYQFSRDH
jgi:hypothetical protein